jgi:hypothetical protein
MRWFRNRLSRPSRCSRSARPALEPLEERCLLASVSYHGGTLLPNVDVETVYYGPQWGSPGGQQNAGQLDTFVNTLVHSPYLDQLAGYSQGSFHIGRGTFLDHDLTTTGWTPGQSVVTEGQIQTMLGTDITTGKLHRPDANRLSVVYLPPNVGSQFDQQNDFVGHHRSFTDSAGDTVFYAVIVDQSTAGLPLGAPRSLTPFQQQTWVTSHELAEAVTDPDLRGGWFNSSTLDEIGDIPQKTLPVGAVDGNLYGYDVQKEWIQADGASELPSGLPQWSGGGTQPVSFNSVVQVAEQNGTAEEFALGSHGSIWMRQQQPATLLWGAWVSVSAPPAFFGIWELQAGRNSDGRVELYALDISLSVHGHRSNQVWTATETRANSGAFNPWADLGSPTLSSLGSLTVADDADGLPQVFLVGSDHAVWTIQEGPLAWGVWTSLGGNVMALSVAEDAVNHLELAALFSDQSVRLDRQTSANGPAWSGWASLGAAAGSVALARNADGSLEVFALGTDSAVHTVSQLGPLGAWGNWTSLGGNVRSITLGQNADGRLEVFAVGQDFQVYAIAQTATSAANAWTWWFGLGGAGGALSTGTTPDGRLEVIALDSFGTVRVATQTSPNAGWN